MEQLRRERNPGASDSRRDSQEQPFRLFVKPAPQEPAKPAITEHDALQERVLAMLANAEAAKAKENAAEAERLAAEAKVKQPEEELQKLKAAVTGDGPKTP